MDMAAVCVCVCGGGVVLQPVGVRLFCSSWGGGGGCFAAVGKGGEVVLQQCEGGVGGGVQQCGGPGEKIIFQQWLCVCVCGGGGGGDRLFCSSVVKRI